MDTAPSGIRWHISSHSGGNDDCVEVGVDDDGSRKVRNSKRRVDEDGRPLAVEFTPSEWAAFIRGVKDGEFD